jgi:pentatricopeptide repeat protein
LFVCPAAAAADFLQPDEVTFAVLLRGYGNQNPPSWQSIDTVLTTMKNTYGIEPTASELWCVWLAVVRACKQRTCLGVQSWHSGHHPQWLPHLRTPVLLSQQTASYNALLEICHKSNDADRALDVIDRMADDGVEPDDVTWELAAKKRVLRSYMRKVLG